MRLSKKHGWIVALVMLVASLVSQVAYADGERIQLSDIRTDNAPKVTIRLSANGATGGPIGGLGPGDFVVKENGQRVEALAAYTIRQGKTPVSLVLAMDTSASMTGDPLAKSKTAAKTLVQALRPVDRMELISFSSSVQTVVPFTGDRQALEKGLDSLAVRGDTALYDATLTAVNDALRVDGTRIVVVLTDGEDTISRSQLSQVMDTAVQRRVPIYTIGLGSMVIDDVLSRMANDTSGRYYKAPKPDDLTYTFRLLSQQIDNQYELYYVSPLTDAEGQKVEATIALATAPDTPLATYSYVMPAAVTGPTPVPIEAGQLRAVPEEEIPPPPAPAIPANPLLGEYAAAATVLGVMTFLMGLYLSTTGDPLEVRMSSFVEGAARPFRSRASSDAGSRIVKVLMRSLSLLVSGLMPGPQTAETRRRLVMAGSPYGWGTEEFLGLRVLFALVFGVLSFLLFLNSRGLLSAVVMGLVFALIGFLIPVFWLGAKVRSRQRIIVKAMPNALDLLSISVEAGLGFDQAVAEVCQKWHNELTREFAVLLGEMQMGRSRREALRGLMERTGVPELGGFASALIQADELGASIARTLVAQADQIRIRRRQRAEQEAREAAVKMLFPLVFLMFPALFVVILGPAIPSITEALGVVGR